MHTMPSGQGFIGRSGHLPSIQPTTINKHFPLHSKTKGTQIEFYGHGSGDVMHFSPYGHVRTTSQFFPSGHTSSGFSQISVQFFLHSLSSLTATRPSSHSYGYIMHFLFSGHSFITGTSGTTGKSITVSH